MYSRFSRTQGPNPHRRSFCRSAPFTPLNIRVPAHASLTLARHEVSAAPRMARRSAVGSPSVTQSVRLRASLGSRLEDDDRSPGRAAGRVAIDVVPHLAPSGPEALVLVSLGRAATDRAGATW